jgi:hypothetical protein
MNSMSQPLDQLDDAVAIFHRRLPADFRIGAGAQSLGDVAADLQRGLHLRCLQCLRIGVDADEIHPFDAAATMCETALPPPPPTPMTLMTALWLYASMSSNIVSAPEVDGR